MTQELIKGTPVRIRTYYGRITGIMHLMSGVRYFVTFAVEKDSTGTVSKRRNNYSFSYEQKYLTPVPEEEFRTLLLQAELTS